MTKQEFANYLYNNSDNLNFLLINEYLFRNYSYIVPPDKLWLEVVSILHDFGIRIFKGNLNNDGVYDALLKCDNNERKIIFDKNLSETKQRHVLYYLLCDFFKYYRELVDGSEYTTYIKLTINGIQTLPKS